MTRVKVHDDNLRIGLAFEPGPAGTANHPPAILVNRVDPSQWLFTYCTQLLHSVSPARHTHLLIISARRHSILTRCNKFSVVNPHAYNFGWTTSHIN